MSNLSPILAVVLLSAVLLCAVSCRKESPAADARAAATDKACQVKWGKPYEQLPILDLAILSANNENIQDEFLRAFSEYHAVNFGQRVRFIWRDVGGGSTSIESYLFNVYGKGGNPEIDIVWGGGDVMFAKLAKGDGHTGPLLEKLPKDVLDCVQADLGGTPLRDPGGRWVGSAAGGFGFICNTGMLRRCGLPVPQTWDDLAGPKLAGLVQLADPMQSGSAATAYRMIAISADDWPTGWARLLGVLSNARGFTDSAGSAANAPVLGEALIATCIDFFGATREVEAPGELKYVSPRGQTAFSPDPIGILKKPPNLLVAQRFVAFVVSRQGQALWGLRVGKPDGPTRTALGRQPIRRDVYDIYAGKFLPYIVNPYRAGEALVIKPQQAQIDPAVLRELIYAAAVANIADMKLARQALIRSNLDPALLAKFNALPDNVATIQEMKKRVEELKDKKRYDTITRDWRDFFHNKYERIVKESPQ